MTALFRGLILALVALPALGHAHGAPHAPPLKGPPRPRRIEIAVTEDGFTPKGVTVKKGERVLLVFTRKAERSCAKKVIVYLDDDKTIEKDLPLGRPVEIRVRFEKAGELGYTCGMGHKAGVIKIE